MSRSRAATKQGACSPLPAKDLEMHCSEVAWRGNPQPWLRRSPLQLAEG